VSECCESNSNATADWGPFCNTFQNGNPLKIVGRNDFLFAAGATAVITGLLFPLSAHILDVFLIFSISLTAAMLITSFAARSALQVLSFPLLIVLATMLRLALSVASAKLILSKGEAGTIISICGGIFVGNNCTLTVLIFSLLVVLIFVVVYKSVKDIGRIAIKFIADIVPIKQTSIACDLDAGVINSEQAFNLREKAAHEAGFFIAMSGAGRFMFCVFVIEFVILIANIAASMAAGVIEGTSGISVKTYVSLAIGAGMMIQISALFVAIASKHLVQKSSAPACANNGNQEQKFTERIKVVASEVTSSQAKELQYENSISHIDVIEDIDSKSADSPQKGIAVPSNNVESGQIIFEELEWSDNKIFDEDKKEDLNLWVWQEIKDSNSYEAIAELFSNKSTDVTQTILMAAENVEELGVTVPVNVAMSLAQRGRKCLLIDLDLERCAISKVFDIDSSQVQSKAIATCVSNLCVLPASNFGKGDATNIKEVTARLESQYDYLIFYAPNIRLLGNHDELAGRMQSAMLFGREHNFKSSSMINFQKLLTNYGCEILEPGGILAEVS